MRPPENKRMNTPAHLTHEFRGKRTPARATAVATALAALSLPAWCDTDATTPASPWSIGALETVTHDSNIFRLADGVAPPSPGSRGDWISMTGLIGTLDQPIGRERLKANAEFDWNAFKDNKDLNSSAHSLSIEGDWATIDRLSGELGYSNSAQLYRYNLSVDQPFTGKNTQTINAGFARFHLGVVTRWTFDAIFNGYDLSYSADPYEPRDLRRWDGSLGATYQSSADLRLTLSDRYTKGEYPNYIDPETGTLAPDHFTRNDINLGVTYAATGASTFRARVGLAHENHSQLTSRSFDVWSADGQWTWKATGRTQLTLDFLRDNDTGATDVSLFTGSNADARNRTALSALLDYEIGAKTQLHGTATYAHRDLDSSFANTPDLNARASDNLWSLGIGFDWLPTRTTRLGCTISRERRTTSGDTDVVTITYPYSATVGTCTGQITFD
jgi:hypothetical protein